MKLSNCSRKFCHLLFSPLITSACKKLISQSLLVSCISFFGLKSFQIEKSKKISDVGSCIISRLCKEELIEILSEWSIPNRYLKKVILTTILLKVYYSTNTKSETQIITICTKHKLFYLN